MRGIASRVVVSSLLSGESEFGEPSKTTLLSLTSVWVFASWDCRGLHTSNTPVSSAIRTTSTTSTLTGTYRSHPRPSTLVVTRQANRMLLFYRHQLSHRLVKNLTAWTARKRGIDRRSWDHNRNVGRLLWRGLFRDAQLGISLEVRRMVRRLIGVLKLGFGSVNLERMTSEISPIRNFRANHLGSNLRPGAEAQFIHHAIQTSRQ